MESKISIIIPMYKVEPYLRQCLDSVVNQTYRNLEIILIDDGSPDRCGEICDEYAQEDSRIVVIHKQNGGLTNAWNDGMKIATGDWITFVDSDDWLELDYFEMMLHQVGNVIPDILQAGGFIEDDGYTQTSREVVEKPFLYENGSGRDYLMARTIGEEHKNGKTYRNFVYVWTKLYRTAYIRSLDLTFDPSIRAGLGCDGLFNFQAFGQAKTVQGCKGIGYHYRRTPESGTLRYGPDRPQAVHYILEKLHDYQKKTTQSDLVLQGVNAYALYQISIALRTYFFHPENPADDRMIAKELQTMKKMPYYHCAIYSGKNPFLSHKQTLMKLLLRLPVIWPWKMYLSKRGRQ